MDVDAFVMNDRQRTTLAARDDGVTIKKAADVEIVYKAFQI